MEKTKEEILNEWLRLTDQTNIKEGHRMVILSAMEEYAEAKLKNIGDIASVMISLDDFPENMPLYKDSGLWQLRSDDMETVVVQQHVNQSDAEFITDCKYLSES